MVSPQFQDSYKKLNPQQKEAVDTVEGPVMVIAGPGTGKTQILTLRIANILLKTQINPENILALTFSEAASFEMRLRLSQIIGTAAFRADISTFHSFANEIIKGYPDEFPGLLSSENITELEQIEIIEKLVETLPLKLLRPFGDPLYYLRDILSAINDLKKEGVSPEKLEVAIKKQLEDFDTIEDLTHEKGPYKGQMKGKYQDLQKQIEKTTEFLQVYIGYQKTLNEDKKYDFNDMLSEVVKVFEENKSLLLRIQEKYQYILVDEHQDTNASQNKLIEQVAKFHEVPNLFVVGDEKQAIYRFQGASLENFLYFKKLYPQAKLINLQTNYRSHQTILDASGSLIEKNISANILPNEKLLTGTKLTPEKVRLAALSNYHLEYDFIASDIEAQIKKGINPSEIAVLGRRNMDLLPLTQSLQKRAVKFVIQSDQDVLSDLQIQKLVMILEAIDDPVNEVLLSRALLIDFIGTDPFYVYKLINQSRKEKIPLLELIDTNKKESGLNGFVEKFKGWVSLNKNIPFDDLFVKVINESGMREYFLKTSDRYQTLNKLTALFDDIKLALYKNPLFNLSDFLKLLATVKKHQVSIRARSDNTVEDGVRLLTVHRSKGLEFDVVYILNCFEGRWGNARKRGVKIKIPWTYLGAEIKAEVEFDEIEDERRLFYVGLTRARKGLILSYAKSGMDGKEQLPSPFLAEIDAKLIEQIDTTRFEKEFDPASLLDVVPQSVIDPKNKEYLQSLFLERGLSATGLDNFLDCPWKYFYRNLVVLPDVKNKYLVFGTAVHAALDWFIKMREGSQVSPESLIKKFTEILDREALSEKDILELREKGAKALGLFYKEVIPSWPKDLQSEMSVRGVRFDEGVVLNGKIDMIEKLSVDGSVSVHDFKTGKPKSRSQIDGSKENGEYNYLRQLTFYKILLDRYKEGLFKMKEGVIDFVEPDDKGKFHSEVFSISEAQVKELEGTIKFVARQIMNLEFWDSRCDDKNCPYCLLREMTIPN